MSSPLSMLKKTKHTPLQQRDKHITPFRRNLLREFQAEVTDNGFSTTGLNPSVTSNPQPSDDAKTPQKKGSPPSNSEHISVIMQRLSRLEERVRVQAQEIEDKDKRISELEKELRMTKENASEKTSRDGLETRYQQLQSQVYEMESFLCDYGLFWVGSGDTRETDKCEQTHSSDRPWRLPEKSLDRQLNMGMNFDQVLQRMQELNILAGEGETYIQATTRGAQLAKKKPIQLRLYRNGIVMFNGPFRSYQEQRTQQFMQDLIDGYFPSELQERFPDGVPFEVHDRRDEEFIIRPQRDTFPGYGQAINSEPGLKNTVTGILKAVSALRLILCICVTGEKLSDDQFLNRLPKVVLKAGQVTDIRDSSRSALQDYTDTQSSNSVILVDTPTLQETKERLQALKPEWSGYDVTTLKIRSEDGNNIYVLKMSFSETIGHLRQHLDKHRGDFLPDYDIISAYPQRCYGDNCQTLQSCGLTTNASLLLRKRSVVNEPIK